MRARAKAGVAWLGVLLCAIAAMLALPSVVLAGTVTNERPLLFSFDGSDTTAGHFTGVLAIASNEVTGDVYVIDGDHQAVDKFNALGEAKLFSATGRSSLVGTKEGTPEEVPFKMSGGAGFADIAIDNSPVNPGRIYVSEEGGPIHAFNPDGSFLWTLPSPSRDICGIAVDREGHLWVGNGNNFGESANHSVVEYSSSGSPPSPIKSVQMTNGNRRPCDLAIDNADKDLYVGIRGFPGPASFDKYTEGLYDSTLTGQGRVIEDVTIDQSKQSGHILGGTHNGFIEYEPCEVLECTLPIVPGSPFGGDLIGSANGIAYNPAEDWVYVSDMASNTVKAFGPVASGPVPDVTSKPTTALTRHTATANGTINPLGLDNAYHFEWAKGGDDVRHLRVAADGGHFTIGDDAQVTDPLPFDASPAAIQSALEKLGSIGTGNVTVTGTPVYLDPALAGQPTDFVPGDYDITFDGELKGVDAGELSVHNIDLKGIDGSSNANVSLFPKGRVANWATAESSPPQAIVPSDSAGHDVSYPMSGLAANTTYSVRLAGTNADNHLNAYSAPPDIFTTPKPPVPLVSIDSIDSITTSSAHVEATIDPQVDPEGDTIVWRLQRSTDPSCTSGFTDVGGAHTLFNPPPGPIAISADLSGLLPAQTYCVRISVDNAGAQGSSDEVFQTLAIPPTDVQTAFAAPRTDTTARINGRVNPQGEADVTYRFETSTDGVNWVARPPLVSTADSRDSIVVADELTGLSPDTTYHYRLAAASNSAGPAIATGQAKSFVTRSTPPNPACPNEEIRIARHFSYLGNCRGIELVNNPDKGDQNAIASAGAAGPSPISPDGDKVLWNVPGGAPGAPNGTVNIFLAERGPAGWASQSTAPPAEEQFGGGELAYKLLAPTPDFETYVFNASRSTGLAPPEPPTLIRVPRGQAEEFLKSYQVRPVNAIYESLIELSDDGGHVLFLDNKTLQLEDIGSGAPEVISLLTNNLPSACGLDVDSGSSFVDANHQPGYHWIATNDASRVYFKAAPNVNCKAPSGLYVRNRTAKEGAGATTLIDPATGSFIRAVPDGTSAYFVTAGNHTTFGRLDPAGADTNADPDVYRWDEETGKAVCMTCAVADANVSGEVLVSDDFSHIYFESRNQLVPGQGKAGDRNLYVLAGGTVGFVADVPEDVLAPGLRPRLSSDGEVLVFGSPARPGMTADAMPSKCIDPETQHFTDCKQLYRYDDRDGGFECLSCRDGAATTHSFGTAGASQGNFRLSGNGTTVAFATPEALLPRDVNRDTDIYEWRDGVLHLLTDGVSDFQTGITTPQVEGIDESGANILFGLVPPAGSLTGFELDGLLNIYDARVDGGFMPPNPPAHCSEESCQGPLQPPPAHEQPGSSGTTGGNLEETPAAACPKGKVRRRGLCVKRHQRKHRRHHKRRVGR